MRRWAETRDEKPLGTSGDHRQQRQIAKVNVRHAILGVQGRRNLFLDEACRGISSTFKHGRQNKLAQGMPVDKSRVVCSILEALLA